MLMFGAFSRIFPVLLVLVFLWAFTFIEPAFSSPELDLEDPFYSTSDSEVPVDKIPKVFALGFSSDDAKLGLKRLAQAQSQFPEEWKIYLQACFALELRDLALFRTSMLRLKVLDHHLFRIVITTYRLLKWIEQGKAQPQPREPSLIDACNMGCSWSFPWIAYSRKTDEVTKRGLAQYANRAIRWKHSIEVIWAFAEALDTCHQDRLSFLIAQKIYQHFGTTNFTGKCAVNYLVRQFEIFGPRGRYVNLMKELGKAPKTKEELFDEFLDMW